MFHSHIITLNRENKQIKRKKDQCLTGDKTLQTRRTPSQNVEIAKGEGGGKKEGRERSEKD